MTTYAIGDIQGCYSALRRLLDKINFQPVQDKLWFMGDLVNRGPESLETLRFIRSLGNDAVTILGNHDLHLLAVAEGLRETKTKDSLEHILNAPDRPELLFWLRQQKLIHVDETLRFTAVHAGIYPSWNLTDALAYAAEVETILRSDSYHELLPHLYGNEPTIWDESLTGWDRLRFIVNAFTRMRYLTNNLSLNFSCKKPLSEAPADLVPWFHFPLKALEESRIIFGHWSALQGKTDVANVYAIDTGYVWGYELTALALESGQRISIPAPPLA